MGTFQSFNQDAASGIIVSGEGTAGTPAGGVVSIQGVVNGINQPVTTKTALTANAPFTVSVGVTSGTFLASNTSRKGLIVVNTSNATVSFGIGTAAVLNAGVTLYPGGTWELDEYCLVTGAINAIAGAAASGVAGQEFQ